MSTASIGTDGWDAIVTTTANTVFQNKYSAQPIALTTESTSGLDYNDSFILQPGESIVIASGNDVAGVTWGADTTIFYMTV